MPSTRRDRRRSGRRRQSVEEDAPSELPVDVPPVAPSEADSPADVPQPDPPLEDPPADDPEEDPTPEDSVEIPGPAKVPESVMEAMADNISEAVDLPSTTEPDEFPCPIDHDHPDFPSTGMLRKHLIIDHGLSPSDVVEAIAKSRGSSMEIAQEEMASLEAVAAEGRAELERGETRPLTDLMHEMLPAPDNETSDQIDKMLNGAETIAAAVAEHGIPDVEISPEAMEKLVQSGQAARIPEFDTYVIRVPKGTVITLEKQE